MIEGVRKRARVFVGDSIIRKTDRVLNKGDDVVVCLPGAKIEAITARVENIVGSGKGGSVLVHVGTNNKLVHHLQKCLTFITRRRNNSFRMERSKHYAAV